MRTNRGIRLLNSKIKKSGELKKIVSRHKNKGKVVVFTNGCFDLLHYGHIKYLEDSKKKGDILIVAVNSDASVKKIKGNKRPIINEKDRLRLIAALESVDYVTLFNENTPLNLIRLLKPDVLIKGADWKKNKIVGGDFIIRHGGKVHTVKLIKGRSTTGLIGRIVKKLRA